MNSSQYRHGPEQRFRPDQPEAVRRSAPGARRPRRQLYSQMPIGDHRDVRHQRARGLRAARRPLCRNRGVLGRPGAAAHARAHRACTWATGAARTGSARPRNGCAGSASARSLRARPGASPARCSSPRTPTSSRYSSPSCLPCWWAAALPIYAVSWPIYALYAAGILFPFTYVLATFGNRLFAEIALHRAGVLRHQRGHRLPPEPGVRLRLPAAPRLRQADRGLHRAQPAPRAAAGRAGGGAPPGRGVRAASWRCSPSARRSRCSSSTPEGSILSVNPAAETLFGYGAAELIGRAGTDTLFPRSPTGQHRARGGRDLHPQRASRCSACGPSATRRDGVEIICEWSLTPLVNPENRVHLGHRAGARHHPAARSRAHEAGIHLDAEPRAAHAADLDHRLAAADQLRRARATSTRTCSS